jgi:hypothetical protein
MEIVYLALAFAAGFGLGGGLCFIWGTKHGSTLAADAHAVATDLAAAKALATSAQKVL